MADIDDDYEAEQTALYEVLAGLDADAWSRPTPAAGWDVRDQVAHLAHTEEVAYDTATGGPRSLANETARYATGEEFTEAGCEQGRSMAPADVLEWWWAAAGRLRPALRDLDDGFRVPWGLGMKRQSFVTARLMEHWAHGLDIRDAVGVAAVDTAHLRHVAWIGYGAIPYAFGVADITAPEGHTLRLDLTGPNGEAWSYGPADATDTITGPAGVWCRRATQRITAAQAGDLKPDGPLAELVIQHARAFL
ncbi:MAG TPA: maleylpyruvate isomerase family mycothiol-dependent enzyme [Acidimicrobiales bacterium]|nr:maleylpyruvate isomerase family mycothiol-dependent enzyme [Acidimicrobiales bacterium]